MKDQLADYQLRLFQLGKLSVTKVSVRKFIRNESYSYENQNTRSAQIKDQLRHFPD